MKQKQLRGWKLSPAEEELLAECRRRYVHKYKESTIIDPDGRIIVKKSMDVEPIMQAMKDYGDILGTKRNDRVAGARLVGGIDPLTASNWARETGLKIGTKEFARFASKRIKEDIDYRRFKVGN